MIDQFIIGSYYKCLQKPTDTSESPTWVSGMDSYVNQPLRCIDIDAHFSGCKKHGKLKNNYRYNAKWVVECDQYGVIIDKSEEYPAATAPPKIDNIFDFNF